MLPLNFVPSLWLGFSPELSRASAIHRAESDCQLDVMLEVPCGHLVDSVSKIVGPSAWSHARHYSLDQFLATGSFESREASCSPRLRDLPKNMLVACSPPL